MKRKILMSLIPAQQKQQQQHAVVTASKHAGALVQKVPPV
jgi:hypothetical protein